MLLTIPLSLYAGTVISQRDMVLSYFWQDKIELQPLTTSCHPLNTRHL